MKSKKPKRKKILKKFIKGMGNELNTPIRRTFIEIGSDWNEYILKTAFVMVKKIHAETIISSSQEEIICKKGDYVISFGGNIFKCRKEDFDKLFISSTSSPTEKTTVALNHLSEILPKKYSVVKTFNIDFWTKVKWIFKKDVVISLNKDRDWFNERCLTLKIE